MNAVNLAEKFSSFSQHWAPKIVGELNGQQVKLARLKGEFVWHQHELEDELFFVLSGILQMHFRDRIVNVGENEFLIVPRGVAHKPVAEEECLVMLFEPAGTLNTGDVQNNLTLKTLEKI